MKSKQGFTLIEILVVFVLIAVLAGLLLPAFHRAQMKGKGASCLNNLKQWGTATQLFMAENNGRLPQDGFATPTQPAHFVNGWYVQLPDIIGVAPYVRQSWRTNAAIEPGRSIWICPSNSRRSNGNLLFHYCLNRQVNGTASHISITRLSNPSATVWLYDNGGLAAVAKEGNVHTNIHERGAHFLFVDGHARRFPVSAYWNSATGRPRTNNADMIWIP